MTKRERGTVPLHLLRDWNLTVANPDEGIRRRKVVDGRSRDDAADGPPYAPALVNNGSDQYWGRAHGWRGSGPYWAPEYVYPPYQDYSYEFAICPEAPKDAP